MGYRIRVRIGQVLEHEGRDLRPQRVVVQDRLGVR